MLCYVVVHLMTEYTILYFIIQKCGVTDSFVEHPHGQKCCENRNIFQIHLPRFF